MKCTDAQSQLHASLDKELAPQLTTALNAYLAQCESCQKLFSEYRQVSELINCTPRPVASEKLRAQIMQKRAAHSQVQGKYAWTLTRRQYTTFTLAASLILGILLVFGLVDNEQGPADPLSSKFVAALNQPSQVNFLVNSKQAYNNVTFSVSVPPDMQLYGYAGKHTLSWNGKLKQGNNLLSVPVVALKPQSGTMVMQIKHNNAVKQYKVFVDVRQDSVLLPAGRDRAVS